MTYRLSPDELLALELSKDLESTPKNIDRVAKKTSPESSRWAFLTWKLRAKATSKVSQPDILFFDQQGLEMSSSEEIAQGIHAEGFPPGALVADLTTGIGLDLIALAKRGPVVGFEINSERARLAQLNLEASGLSGEIRNEDCLECTWNFEYAFADPARRKGQERTLHPEDFQPSLNQLIPMLRALKLAKLKLSPMLPDTYLDEISSTRIFVSHKGECKEVVALLGSEVENIVANGVWAYHAESATWIRGGLKRPNRAHKPAQYLFECDPAVIRADATATYGISALGDVPGYLTDDSKLGCRPEKAYKVLWFGPFRIQSISQACQDHGLRVEVIKVRGPELDPTKVRKVIKPGGSKVAVLLAYLQDRKVCCVLAEPAL